MKDNFKAVRVEIPEELYERFKTQTKKQYKTISSVIRDYIVEYVTSGEGENKEIIYLKVEWISISFFISSAVCSNSWD